MAIDYTHKEDLELFVKDNIQEINGRISAFRIKNKKVGEYSDVDIKRYLKNKLISEFPNCREEIVKRFEDYNCSKSKIRDIANEFIFYHKDLETLLESTLLEELKGQYSQQMVKDVVDAIFQNSSMNSKRKNFLKTTVTGITKKSLRLILQNGFSSNLNNIESGVMTANEGDSAQFLFLSKAILAGFNCSNVDVRSSRYDAVIDFKNKIFRVQIKGISGSTVSFKDRDRGGEGIDTHNARNIGKRITSDDCDIFAAVDKQVGLCYIIPMKDIDPWDDEQIKNVNVKELEHYLENWGIIRELYEGNTNSSVQN